MLSDLGWRSLENRRNDARLAMFYKITPITHGLFVVSVPTYFESPIRLSRHMHPVSFRQVHATADYYRYSFFSMTVVLWNRLPAGIVLLKDLDSFKLEVSKINHQSHEKIRSVFKLLLSHS